VVYRQLGWKTVGVDAGERQRQFARDVLKLDIRTEVYSRNSFPAGSVDMIHCYHTIEHVEFPFEVLQNFGYHLHQRGILYVETPNIFYTGRPSLGFGHINLFSPRTLKQSLENCGFEIISVLNRSHYPTHGIGILACKKGNVDHMLYTDQLAYLPITPADWRKDPFTKLKIRLLYALFDIRPIEITLLNLPICTIKLMLRRYVRNEQIKSFLRNAANRIGLK